MRKGEVDCGTTSNFENKFKMREAQDTFAFPLVDLKTVKCVSNLECPKQSPIIVAEALASKANKHQEDVRQRAAEIWCSRADPRCEVPISSRIGDIFIITTTEMKIPGITRTQLPLPREQ